MSTTWLDLANTALTVKKSERDTIIANWATEAAKGPYLRMPCPLCDDPAALLVAEEFDLRVTCEPCSGAFTVTDVALEQWQRLGGASRAVALELARKHLAKLRRFAAAPQIQVRDVWA